MESSVNQYYWLRDWAVVIEGPHLRVRACASVNAFAGPYSCLRFLQIYRTLKVRNKSTYVSTLNHERLFPTPVITEGGSFLGLVGTNERSEGLSLRRGQPKVLLGHSEEPR